MRALPALIGCSLLLAGCGTGDALPEESDASPSRPVVKLAEVQVGDGIQVSEAAGTVRLRAEVELAFTSPGKIARILVDEGDSVASGQLLAALERDTVGAELASARAEVDRLRSERERSRALFDDGWVTQARLDDIEAATRAAEARVQAASFAVRTAEIRAPSNGVVLERMAEAGQVVQPGTPILSVGRGDQGFVFVAPLTDRQAAKLSSGGSATVVIPALGDAPVTATLVELAGRADAQTGTFAAEFALPARPGLRSGQIGSVQLTSDADAGGGTIIPASAVTSARAGEALVWVFDPATEMVELRVISPGELVDGGLQVSSGLEPGERVVVAGMEELEDGLEVTPQ